MKRPLSIAASAGLALALAATSLQATAAPKPHITDPVGDANFVNDQGSGDGSFGDFNQADAGTVSDLIEVTFSNNAKNLTIMIGTEAAPPAITGIGYRVRVNPDGAGGAYCLLFEAYHPGANNALTTAFGNLIDACGGGDPIPLKVVGTQLVIPRKAHKAFGKGAKLVAPQAQAFLYSGNESGGAKYPVVDTTKVGTDFKFKK
jgi:hypothetical protein